MPNYLNILVEEETNTKKVSEKKEEGNKVDIKKKIITKNILNTRYCYYHSEEEE